MRLSDLICGRQSDTPLLLDGKEGRGGRRNNLRKKPGCHVSMGKILCAGRRKNNVKQPIWGKFVGEKGDGKRHYSMVMPVCRSKRSNKV